MRCIGACLIPRDPRECLVLVVVLVLLLETGAIEHKKENLDDFAEPSPRREISGLARVHAGTCEYDCRGAFKLKSNFRLVIEA